MLEQRASNYLLWISQAEWRPTRDVLALFAGSALLRKLLRPESHPRVVRHGDA